MPNRISNLTADRNLLTKLVCPITGGPLALIKNKAELYSQSAKLAFPIRDGIPILVIGEAREIATAEAKKLAK